MKKNYTIVFAVIAAVIVLCAFWGCSSSDDDDGPSLPPAEEAPLGNTMIPLAEGEQVYEANGSPYNPGSTKNVKPETDTSGSSSFHADLETLSSITADGKLTLKLPVFTDTYWNECNNEYIYIKEGDGLTANPSDVRYAHVHDFRVVSESLRLVKTKGANTVTYLYVDKDARIWGETEEGDGMTNHVNLNLKRGWNSVIQSVSGSNMTTAGGIPDGDYKWVVEAD
ncbi:MAG: hypothetical protein LBK13_12420 [Spirochaetales bacterium]|jgi:hypothetical protein|nr:hypothetical protein [Spirochaetales bacterium]